MTRLLFDSHLDLAWNTASFDRDLTLTLEQMCDEERSMTDKRFRGHATLTFPELRRTGIAVCIATLLSRSGPEHVRQSAYQRGDLDYATRLGCHAAAHAQLACYHYWESIGEIKMLMTQEDLQEHDALWRNRKGDEKLPIGIILSMEGADPVMSPDTLVDWWDLGLRAIEPAHYGRSHYASGTATEGPLTDAGRELIDEMGRVGIALDVTHLCDESMAEALDRYQGPVWASHHNCRALVPGDRQLTDDQIRQLIARDGVIGLALDAWMLRPGWIRGETDPSTVSMQDAADHVDHVCQIAGNTRHSGIGSDLDGGYGTEQTPGDLKTIYDILKLEDILSGRGYSDADIDAIFYDNWVRKMMATLPTRE
jgi:membrane dipeptidase